MRAKAESNGWHPKWRSGADGSADPLPLVSMEGVRRHGISRRAHGQMASLRTAHSKTAVATQVDTQTELQVFSYSIVRY